NPSPVQPVGAMSYFPYLYELSPVVFLVQVAMTVWMLVDASRRGVEFYWYWLIIGAQPFGPWAYFFVYKVKDFHGGGAGFRDVSGTASPGGRGGLFHRRPSMHEVRYGAEQSPTLANRLELAERQVELGEFAEAVPHLEAMLKHEPGHAGAHYLLAQAHRGLGH